MLFRNTKDSRDSWFSFHRVGFCVGVWTVAVLLSSCSISQHMDEKTAELMKQMDEIPHWDQLPIKEITWTEAFDKMMKGNMDLKRSEQALRQRERAVYEVFTQFIPGVNLDWMLTKELGDLANVQASEFEYNTNILFNMPSLTQIPFDYYSAKASLFAAEKTQLMKHRELLSKLYVQVLSYKNAQLNYGNLIDNLPFDDDGVQRAKIDKDWEKQRNEIAQGFARLFGDMSARWLVKPDSMPRIDWTKYKSASKKLDKLVVMLVALELEASRLKVLDAKMNFFPSVEINFYSPSLFSSTGGTYGGFFAGAGDMKVNLSIKEEIDTRLTNWFHYKDAKETHELMKKEVVMELQERRQKVKLLIESRDEFEEWHKYISKEVEFKKSRVATNADEYIEMRKDLRKLYEQLDGEASKNAEVEGALIMEYGWLD